MKPITWTHSSTRSKEPVLQVSIIFSITLSLSTFKKNSLGFLLFKLAHHIEKILQRSLKYLEIVSFH